MLRQLVGLNVPPQYLLPPTLAEYLDLLEGHLMQEGFDESIGECEHLGGCGE